MPFQNENHPWRRASAAFCTCASCGIKKQELREKGIKQMWFSHGMCKNCYQKKRYLENK